MKKYVIKNENSSILIRYLLKNQEKKLNKKLKQSRFRNIFETEEIFALKLNLNKKNYLI